MIADRRAMVASLALLGSLSLGDSCDAPAPLRILAARRGRRPSPTVPCTSSSTSSRPRTPPRSRSYLNGSDITDCVRARAAERRPHPRGRRFRLGAGPRAARRERALRAAAQRRARRADRIPDARAIPSPTASSRTRPARAAASARASCPASCSGRRMAAGLYQGSLDVLSLGLSGSLVLGFTNNVIVRWRGRRPHRLRELVPAAGRAS